jgi:hypothetical protein
MTNYLSVICFSLSVIENYFSVIMLFNNTLQKNGIKKAFPYRFFAFGAEAGAVKMLLKSAGCLFLFVAGQV